jgi:hypothetical protein
MENLNNIDPMWLWVALGVAAALIVVGLIARAAGKSRSNSLREKFGSEYDHAVNAAGSKKKAERELVERTQELDRHDIRPLTAAESASYRSDWQRVEQHFIERPTTAVVEADELVASIMNAQGYPMGDFEKHAAHLSVRSPRVVSHYREGHKVMEGAPGSASTEDLRQAMLHYRALFTELVGTAATAGLDVAQPIPRANEVMTSGLAADAPKEAIREEAVRADPARDFNKTP